MDELHRERDPSGRIRRVVSEELAVRHRLHRPDGGRVRAAVRHVPADEARLLLVSSGPASDRQHALVDVEPDRHRRHVLVRTAHRQRVASQCVSVTGKLFHVELLPALTVKATMNTRGNAEPI